MAASLDPAGVAVFFAVISAIVALSLGRPEQWGLRHLSWGACACASCAAAIMLSSSPWWWGGILWGLHQMYLGWSFISRRRRTTHDRAEYLQASVSVLTYIALADGEITPREAQIIRGTYVRAGFSSEDLRNVEQILRECERRFFTDGSDPNRLFRLLRDACAVVLRHSNDHTRLSFFRTAVLIAGSDGFINAGEDRAIQAAANWLLIASEEVDQMWRSVLEHGPGPFDEEDRKQAREEPVVPPDLATYYASILGIAVTASPQEVKRAYREKAKQYHPDVAVHRGAAFANEAEERFKELSMAYEFFGGARVAT
jgi:DnaJ like chaperone protein